VIKPRAKKCHECGNRFMPRNSLTKACSPACAISIARKEIDKAERKANREAKARLKTRGEWAKEAQAAFNKWVRQRDADKPCVSCGCRTAAQWDAGHYRTVGGNPELRFEPLNCWKQCSTCNNHLSGNIVNYRKTLVNYIGEAGLDWLEGPHEAKKYSIDELKAIKQHYSKLANELEKARAA
tara:strand:- start:33078 stop:33623 length:546 start_codon:yes stop_codon:yes gene_type:complete